MRALLSTILVACCLSFAAAAFGAKHETWYEARSPHFIVVCNAGEKQARKTALQFEQIRSVFRQYIVIASGRASPVITIFAVRDENSLRELLPEYWATKGHTHPGGIFFYNLGQFEAAVQLDAQGTNPYEAIYHEYYHSLTVPYFPGLPVWLAEGLADFFGNTEVNEKEARLGEPDPGLIEELRQNRLIPLDVLFKVDHTSPYYNEQNKTSIFYAESWALTHYLMLGDNGSHKPLLMAYLQALQQGAAPEEAAAKGFGDLSKLQKALDRYVSGSSFFEVKGPAPPPVADADLRSRELSDAEADAYLGGFAALRERPQEAKPLLDQAVQLDPKLPLAYQNLGLMELFAGQRSEAFASFSQAVELDPKNALTRYFRAYLAYRQRTTATGDEQIEDDLRQAIAANPDFAPPYGLLAVYLANSNENLPEALSLAQKGVSLEPGRATYVLSLAQVLARMRRFDDAEAVAQRARASAIDPAERSSAEQFLAYLQRAKDIASENRMSESSPSATGAATRTPQGSDDGKEDTSRSGVATWEEASGLITDSRCAGVSQQIDLQTSTATLHLRGPAEGGLKINLSFDPQPGFNPCTSLKGMRASVLYKPDAASGQGGTITSLRVFGPAGGSDSGDAVIDGTKRSAPSEGDTGGKDAGMSATEAEGQITDVTCSGSDMLLKIATPGRQFALHTRDYAHLDYYDDHAGPRTDEFQPCTQLKGHTVSIIFLMVEHKRYDGEMQSVEIEK